MKIGEMNFPDILKKYRDRDVLIIFKSGKRLKTHVDEIENQLDGWDDVLFMVTAGNNPTIPVDAFLKDIEDIQVLN
ncbi:hypothetical protein [Lacticaseibacillus paracasei]|uniref:hypothetical protein n=1 Tax=Lacticaseibacillus paracasei TaxID=1597 RepID=UPI000FF3D6DE|nr:hypothetical protein [Lacticaseibacillus paracasei]RND56636.1 hypothetical protein FAM18119_01952 [Lacticaseibacillus paracasei]RNE25005.1 hypothetical protein FAM6165_02784 [Lacticaseibacillus paracasei]VTZ84182.1 hypothetical protein LPCP272_02150 [Lacticaseibacillus paracasei]